METSVDRKVRLGFLFSLIIISLFVFILFVTYPFVHASSIVSVHFGDIGGYSMFYFDNQVNASTTDRCYYGLDINNVVAGFSCVR